MLFFFEKPILLSLWYCFSFAYPEQLTLITSTSLELLEKEPLERLVTVDVSVFLHYGFRMATFLFQSIF